MAWNKVYEWYATKCPPWLKTTPTAYCETFATISKGVASQEGKELIRGKELLSTFEILIMCQKSNEESLDCCLT